MTIKTLKARILQALRSSLPAPAAGAGQSPPPSPTKPGRASDDASFFDAHENPAKIPLADADDADPIDDDWELVEEEDPDANEKSPASSSRPEPDLDPLREFPARCPPGGEEAVVLYTTTLRGVRKTFEDCNEVRALLENLAVPFQERDVSMDRGLREQLWAAAGAGERPVVPPRLFVRGRDLGGAAQVLALHDDGRLLSLLQHPLSAAASRKTRAKTKKKGKCEACGGVGFVVCGECDGSRKVFDGGPGRCGGCNENGLVMCALCLSPS